MKLNYSLKEICHATKGEIVNEKTNSLNIESISYDSRKIIYPNNTIFFALLGEFRNGHDYIEEAYKIGVRNFCISKNIDFAKFKEATFILVKDTLLALQDLAFFHRNKFNISLIVITGSAGKTSVKEWLYVFLSSKYRVVRSPKSFNSQIGVSLSLLEIQDFHQIALIECGISKPGEMEILQKLTNADVGIFTSLGTAHESNFNSKDEQLREKLKLFLTCKVVFHNSKIKLSKSSSKYFSIDSKKYKKYFKNSVYFSAHQRENASLCIAVSKYFEISDKQIIEKISQLPQLALRMELIEGKNNTLLINDTYNADFDALISSLEYLQSIKSYKDKSIVLGIDDIDKNVLQNIKNTLNKYSFKNLFLVKNFNYPPIECFNNEVVLVKGTRKSQLEKWINLIQEKKHQTYLEIDLSAMKNNLNFWKSFLKKDEKILVMVKASAYGTGAVKTAIFLQDNGVDYLGVAYSQEGIELRNNGINLPILVMNADEYDFPHLIKYKLEPSIYSINFLDKFIHFLIQNQIDNYPIHLKFDTGMKRLGFEVNEVDQVLDKLLSQNEVKVVSVYSHLANSDNFDDESFLNQQVKCFNKIVLDCENRLPYPFLKHISNTEAINRDKMFNTNMFRLGIGLYGISQNIKINSKLKNVLSWKSSVSQIKKIKKGESIGYGRSFIAKKDLDIAIIPVGYADGFRRALSNGKGGVFINNLYCKVLGKVCMDMIMVDISKLNINENNEVEIIGNNQSLEDLSSKIGTIPYETLSTFSTRLNRIYIEV